MDSDPSGANLDDREEGEIVDDDFEDISDNSIIVPIFSGKSVSPKEHLQAISLSSVTDADEPKSENKPRRHHKVPKKKVSKSKKRRNSHRKSTCSDSDSDDFMELDRKLQKQLSAAIRVDDTEDRHKNSLQSRLKAMTKLDESDACIEKIDNEKVEEKNTSDEGDSELAQLRLEALRTAVLNKFMHRKKRKVKESIDNDVLSDMSVKTDNSETNKENNQTVENCSKKVCVDNSAVQNIENKIEISKNVIENNTPPEDDEDVLRALLLASMSKKIISEKETTKTVLPLTNNGIKRTAQNKDEKKETPKVTTNNIISFKNRVTKNNIGNKNLQLPKVKPLIININEDSDSDDDIFNKTIKNTENQMIQPKQIDIEIENSVDKFLKEQRAKVEAQLSPIQKCPAKPKNSSLILEKSCVKLLPKVKQVEYRKLLQKLKNAEKKPRIRRLSHKLNADGKPIAFAPKKVVKTKVPVNIQVTSVSKVDSIVDVKSEVRTLHKILKEIQVQRNGRLQIQEKYKVLMPVIKKINEASVERRKWEDQVKRLLQEISDMKMKLVKSQQDFNAQVNYLVKEKERIDKSMHTKKSELAEDAKAHFTSTPIKDNPSVVSFETSSLPITTPNNTLPLSEKIAEPSVETQMEEDVVDVPLNPGDPNDIDKIISKQKNTFPKYISPLDSVKRVARDDPFSIVCPYEVDGNCRDPECIYKHLFK